MIAAVELLLALSEYLIRVLSAALFEVLFAFPQVSLQTIDFEKVRRPEDDAAKSDAKVGAEGDTASRELLGEGAHEEGTDCVEKGPKTEVEAYVFLADTKTFVFIC